MRKQPGIIILSHLASLLLLGVLSVLSLVVCVAILCIPERSQRQDAIQRSRPSPCDTTRAPFTAL